MKYKPHKITVNIRKVYLETFIEKAVLITLTILFWP